MCGWVWKPAGNAFWFERLLRHLQFELWIGDAAEIRTKRVRKQKTDRQDAQLLLHLMIEDRFPRIWVADAENRDLRQLPISTEVLKQNILLSSLVLLLIQSELPSEDAEISGQVNGGKGHTEAGNAGKKMQIPPFYAMDGFSRLY
jgi:hypothetical protein